MSAAPAGILKAQEWKLLFGLRGEWRFSIGDDLRRAQPGFDDHTWETIHAPAPWEDEGYPGYDGYAWYRKHFRSEPGWNEKSLALHLGVIDDVDEVYLNGHLVGSMGNFPPHYATAYSAERIYPFPSAYLAPGGDNVVAVRVYDDELSGGILRGNLGVYEDRKALQVDMAIGSGWKFNPGDDSRWKEPAFNDTLWYPIQVPAYWEHQGYPGYDGFAWYRVRFNVSNEMLNQQLILILGKIDDFDEAYCNGKLVGHTGTMRTRGADIPGSEAYRQLRAYYLPAEILHAGSDNLLAVRVYDGFKDGGIYAGPVGITTRERYLRWNTTTEPTRHWFDWLFR
jgi:sialate O-acetylesterase